VNAIGFWEKKSGSRIKTLTIDFILLFLFLVLCWFSVGSVKKRKGGKRRLARFFEASEAKRGEK